jgi:hypothetical protein
MSARASGLRTSAPQADPPSRGSLLPGLEALVVTDSSGARDDASTRTRLVPQRASTPGVDEGADTGANGKQKAPSGPGPSNPKKLKMNVSQLKKVEESNENWRWFLDYVWKEAAKRSKEEDKSVTPFELTAKTELLGPNWSKWRLEVDGKEVTAMYESEERVRKDWRNVQANEVVLQKGGEESHTYTQTVPQAEGSVDVTKGVQLAHEEFVAFKNAVQGWFVIHAPTSNGERVIDKVRGESKTDEKLQNATIKKMKSALLRFWFNRVGKDGNKNEWSKTMIEKWGEKQANVKKANPYVSPDLDKRRQDWALSVVSDEHYDPRSFIPPPIDIQGDGLLERLLSANDVLWEDGKPLGGLVERERAFFETITTFLSSWDNLNKPEPTSSDSPSNADDADDADDASTSETEEQKAQKAQEELELRAQTWEDMQIEMPSFWGPSCFFHKVSSDSNRWTAHRDGATLCWFVKVAHIKITKGKERKGKKPVELTKQAAELLSKKLRDRFEREVWSHWADKNDNQLSTDLAIEAHKRMEGAYADFMEELKNVSPSDKYPLSFLQAVHATDGAAKAYTVGSGRFNFPLKYPRNVWTRLLNHLNSYSKAVAQSLQDEEKLRVEYESDEWRKDTLYTLSIEFKQHLNATNVSFSGMGPDYVRDAGTKIHGLWKVIWAAPRAPEDLFVLRSDKEQEFLPHMYRSNPNAASPDPDAQVGRVFVLPHFLSTTVAKFRSYGVGGTVLQHFFNHNSKCCLQVYFVHKGTPMLPVYVKDNSQYASEKEVILPPLCAVTYLGEWKEGQGTREFKMPPTNLSGSYVPTIHAYEVRSPFT